VIDLLSPATSGSVQLEWPQVVGGIFEVGTNGQDLMNEILHADNSKLAQTALNDVIGSDCSAVSSDLDVSSLVYKLTD